MDLVILLVLILLNGLFAMSEIALVTAKRSRLQRLSEQGNKAAKTAMKLGEDSTQFLSTIQIGITAIGILSGIFGEAALAKPVAELLVEYGVRAKSSSIIATTIVVVGITYLSIVIGELVPKRMAQFNAEGIALKIARPIALLALVSKPFVCLLSVSTNALLRMLGKSSSDNIELTEEDIHAMLAEGSQVGIIEKDEHDIVRNAFRLDTRQVASLMTPRNEIVAIDIDKPISESLECIHNSTFSRFPVFQESMDNILGFVTAKALLKCPANAPCFGIRHHLVPAAYVPESLSVMKLLKLFRESDSDMVFVVDEFGDLQGVITLYDVLKAITGEFKGGDDIWIKVQENGDIILDGLIPIPELKDALELKSIPNETKAPYRTLSGMIMFLIAKIPEIGDTVEWEEWTLKVVNLDGNRVDKVFAKRRS